MIYWKFANILIRFLVPATLIIVIHSSAVAQQLDEQLLFEEIPLVYSASKYEQKVTEAPSSVLIVTAEEIKLYGYQTLADIFNSLPGFLATDDYNYGYLGMRGFSRPGDYNSRLLFLLDGQRINDSLYDSEGILQDAVISVNLIESIEIVLGPGSTLYGSSAFFGIVNIITKTGQQYQGVEATVDIGKFDAYKTQLTIGNRLQNGLDYIVSGSVFRRDGINQIYFPEFDDPATNNGFASGVDREESENLFAHFSYLDFDLTASYVSRDKVIPTASFGTVFNSPESYTTDDKLFIGGQYIFNFSNTTSLTSRVSYNQYEYFGEYLYDYAEDDDPPYLVTNQDEAEARSWNFELLLVRQLERSVLTAGVEYRNNFRLNQGNFDPDYTYLDDKRSSNVSGVFIQDEFSVNDRLTLTGGLRYDHHNFSGGQLNPRIAAVYNLNGNDSNPSVLRMSYGTAYRAPNAVELFYNDMGETTKAALNLKHETINTVQIGIDHYFSPQLKGSVSFFRYGVSNLIDLKIDPLDDLLVYDNISEVKAKGFEALLEGKLTETLTGRLSYSYTDAEDKTSRMRLTNSPIHLAKLNVMMPLWTDQVTGAVELQYRGPRYTLSNDQTSTQVPVSLVLTSEDIVRGLDLSLRVDNIFDDDISMPGLPEHVQDILPRPGRTFNLRVSYNF